MTARTDTATHPDIRAIRDALGSISVSGAAASREQKTLSFVDLFLMDYSEFEPRPILVKLRQSSKLSAWIDKAFVDLTDRLASAPDQDLLDAAHEVTLVESSIITDEWIESISDRWSRFQD